MKKDILRVKLKSYDTDVIEKSMQDIVNVLKDSNATFFGPIPLPTKINKFTVLRSPHVDKKSREQFEMRTHKRLIDIIAPNPKVMDTFTSIKLPEAVEIDIKQMKK